MFNAVTRHRIFCIVASVLMVAVVTGCIKTQPTSPAGGKGSPDKAGGNEAKISIEGSSTVFPISQAVGVEYERANPDIRVTVAGNGTSSGFKKLLNREAEICDASRPITEK